MARYEISNCDEAALGESPADAGTFFELGMMYSVGRSVPIDYVSAHKWFNLAAMRGSADASLSHGYHGPNREGYRLLTCERILRYWRHLHA